MKDMQKPRAFVIVQERAAGNAEVGTSWQETGVFPPTATLAEVWEWALGYDGSTGRTTIRPEMGPHALLVPSQQLPAT
jgi:hypothetical protein